MPMAETHGQQALVFDFDSIQQRSLWEMETNVPTDAHQFPPASVTQRFSGLLRTADILTHTILVPDAQLLDGALFMHHGPEAVRSLLGRNSHERLGLVVVARDASLAECLRKMVCGRNEEATVLAVFEFSSLAVFGLDPRRIAEAVSRRPSRRLRDCHTDDVPEVVAAEFQAAAEGLGPLEEIQHPTGVFAAMALRWRDWIAAVAKDPQTIRVWDSRKFDMELAFARRQVPPAIEQLDDHANESGRGTIATLKGLRGRSSMLATLAALETQVPPETIGLMDSWWSSVYFDALARQHESSWLKLQNTDAEAFDMASSQAVGTTTLQFEGSLIDVLGEMPASTFALAKYSARVAISRWVDSPVARHSDGLAFAIMKFVEPVDRQETMRNLWRQISFTLVPGVLGLAASYFFSAVAGIWAVVVGAVGVLLTTPISELVELHTLRSKKMKSFINIPGGVHD